MSDSICNVASTLLRRGRGTWRRRASSAIAVTVTLLVGTASVVAAQTSAKRKFVDRKWVALWHTSGDPDDALFGLPREIAASEAGLFVLDVGTRQLSAFGRNAGKRWTIGKQGRGPGEFLRPVDLALLPNGEIGVLDPDNGRVSIFAASGKFRTSIATSAAAISSSFCATGDGHLHFVSTGTKEFLISVDSAGKPVNLLDFPWAAQVNAPRLVKSATFSRGRAGAECTLATTFGFGMATLHSNQPLRTRPFIEQLALPKIEQKRVGNYTQQTVTEGENAARGAFHWRDTLFVSFAGASKTMHLLDLYDRDGNYIESWTPPAGSWYAYANGMLYAIVNSADSPAITAFVAASDTARILTELRAGRAPGASRARGAARPSPPPAKKRQPGN